MQQVTTSNYSGTSLTLEVGSRGFLTLSNFTKLQHELLVCKKSAWRGFYDGGGTNSHQRFSEDVGNKEQSFGNIVFLCCLFFFSCSFINTCFW